MSITLEQASTIVDAVLAAGEHHGFAPLTCAVLDPGGHVVALKRADNSGILRPDIAIGKAWGALGMGLPTRVLAQRAEHMAQLFTALAAVSGGRMVPVPGGVLIRHAGQIIGAVGVSGDLSEPDEQCAVEGIEAAGLEADVGDLSD
ncbi:MAG: heme-binding protein [Nitriliruptorales bacterium]|nr:heme-binding protein [Nitriliruptorales bacterium]